MKRVWIAACALLLVSVAALAAPAPAPAPRPTPLSDEALAAILSGADEGGFCATPRSQGTSLAAAAAKAICTATASCESGTVSCSGNPTCTAVDRDCSILERGHVVCGGVTTNCPTACCSSGTVQQRACCRCDATNDCVDCCRCAGGGAGQCVFQCGG